MKQFREQLYNKKLILGVGLATAGVVLFLLKWSKSSQVHPTNTDASTEQTLKEIDTPTPDSKDIQTAREKTHREPKDEVPKLETKKKFTWGTFKDSKQYNSLKDEGREYSEKVAADVKKESKKKKTQLMDPKIIRYTQDSISTTFSDGKRLGQTLLDLQMKKIKVWDIPFIRVTYLESEGQWYGLDNRRLWVFKRFGKRIPVKRVSLPGKFFDKYTTKNKGLTVALRSGE